LASSQEKRRRAGKKRERPPNDSTLRRAVAHAVLARQRLDEVLERRVAAHVVRRADCALHLEQAGRERRVERLEVEAQLAEQRLQRAAPGLAVVGSGGGGGGGRGGGGRGGGRAAAAAAAADSAQRGVEAAQGRDALARVELGLEGADALAGDAAGQGGGARGGVVADCVFLLLFFLAGGRAGPTFLCLAEHQETQRESP